MIRILLIGELYSSNLGDGILCECAQSLIKQKIKDVEIDVIDLSLRENYSNKKEDSLNKKRILNALKSKLFSIDILYANMEFYINSINSKSLQEKIRKKCDKKYNVAVFAGGQMFMNCFSIPIYYFVEELSSRNIPIIFNSCGVGKTKSMHARKKFKKALNNEHVKLISSRDDVDSINKLYLNNCTKKAIKTYDLGLWTKETYKIHPKNKDIVGLGVMYLPTIAEEKVIKFWVNIIRELERRNICWKIFCNGNLKDYQIGKKILAHLSMSENKLLKRPTEPKELVETISLFKSIISYRLHSHIIATSLGIPAVAIEWDKKLRFFYKNIEKEQRCLKFNDSPKKIISQLEEAEKNKYNKQIIENQKVYARDLLIESIIKYAEKGEKT